MKSPLLLSVIALPSPGAGAQSAHDARDRNTEIKDRLSVHGLVPLEEPSADGQLHKADCAGMFFVTRDGRASIQIMYRNADTASAYAHSGYEASYGSYHIDEASPSRLTSDAALARPIIGKDLRRAYQISGELLTIRSTNPHEHWKVVWERY